MTWNEIARIGKAEKTLQVGRNIALRKKTGTYNMRLLRGNHHFKISTHCSAQCSKIKIKWDLGCYVNCVFDFFFKWVVP